MALLLEMHEGVEAQTEAERLEADDALEWDVGAVDISAEPFDQQFLDSFVRRLENEAFGQNAACDDVLDEVKAQLAVSTADATLAGFARLEDHVIGTGF